MFLQSQEHLKTKLISQIMQESIWTPAGILALIGSNQKAVILIIIGLASLLFIIIVFLFVKKYKAKQEEEKKRLLKILEQCRVYMVTLKTMGIVIIRKENDLPFMETTVGLDVLRLRWSFYSQDLGSVNYFFKKRRLKVMSKDVDELEKLLDNAARELVKK